MPVQQLVCLIEVALAIQKKVKQTGQNEERLRTLNNKISNLVDLLEEQSSADAELAAPEVRSILEGLERTLEHTHKLSSRMQNRKAYTRFFKSDEYYEAIGSLERSVDSEISMVNVAIGNATHLTTRMTQQAVLALREEMREEFRLLSQNLRQQSQATGDSLTRMDHATEGMLEALETVDDTPPLITHTAPYTARREELFRRSTSRIVPTTSQLNPVPTIASTSSPDLNQGHLFDPLPVPTSQPPTRRSPTPPPLAPPPAVPEPIRRAARREESDSDSGDELWGASSSSRSARPAPGMWRNGTLSRHARPPTAARPAASLVPTSPTSPTFDDHPTGSAPPPYTLEARRSSPELTPVSSPPLGRAKGTAPLTSIPTVSLWEGEDDWTLR